MIALKIEACEKAGMSFADVIAAVDAYIAEQHTYFVLESLEALRKNGRLSNLKAFVANALNIKPVSYPHLDVYKRQLLDNRVNIFAVNGKPSICI